MDPITLALLGLPQVFKLGQGLAQAEQAKHLKVQDTTPPAFREALALGRQGAASSLPGTAQLENGLSAGENDAVAAATRAGTSGTSVLGLLQSADANRQQQLAGLETRQDAYHQQQLAKLGGLEQQQAQYQQHDQETFDKNRAALREGSLRNVFSAIEGASQVGAYALDGGTGLSGNAALNTTKKGIDNSFVKRATSSFTERNDYLNQLDKNITGSDDMLTLRRKAYGTLNQYGVPDYGATSV